MRGLIFVAGTIVFWGITPLFEKLAFKEKPDPFLILWYRLFVVFIILTVGLTIAGRFGEMRQFTSKAFIYMGIAGITAGLLAQLCFYFAFDKFHLHNLVPLTSIYPLVTFFAVLLFLPSEAGPLSPSKIIVKLAGVLLIAAGVILVAYRPQGEADSSPALRDTGAAKTADAEPGTGEQSDDTRAVP